MMDAQTLFDKSKKHSPKENQRIITCGDEFDDQPMIFGLKLDKNHLKFGNSLQRFKWFSQGAVDIGFISSIDFSRLKGGWKVFPNICKSSLGKSRIALFFNKNLSEINTIAVPLYSSTSAAVMQVLFKELYQIECKIIRSDLGLESALKKYDAALLTGSYAIKEISTNASFIDLGEEWFDLTGLPLVFGFWIGNELIVNKDDYQQLSTSLKLGSNSINKIAGNIPGKENQIILQNFLLKHINYNFGDEEKNALDEFYQYAFFYGLVDYIPDFNFLEV